MKTARHIFLMIVAAARQQIVERQQEFARHLIALAVRQENPVDPVLDRVAAGDSSVGRLEPE